MNPSREDKIHLIPSWKMPVLQMIHQFHWVNYTPIRDEDFHHLLQRLIVTSDLSQLPREMGSPDGFEFGLLLSSVLGLNEGVEFFLLHGARSIFPAIYLAGLVGHFNLLSSFFHFLPPISQAYGLDLFGVGLGRGGQRDLVWSYFEHGGCPDLVGFGAALGDRPETLEVLVNWPIDWPSIIHLSIERNSTNVLEEILSLEQLPEWMIDDQTQAQILERISQVKLRRRQEK